MLNIYIVRHGQDEDNQNGILNGHRDMPLTELGKTQAQQLAQKIKNIGIHFDKAYSSPLQRAYITWKIITDALSIDAPEQLDIFIERDFGSMTGKAIQDIEILCAPNIIKSETVIYFLNPEGAETFPQVLRRAKQALTYIQKKHKNGNILLTTHWDFGKMLYTAYYGLSRTDTLVNFHFGNWEVLLLSLSITEKEAHLFQTKQYNH